MAVRAVPLPAAPRHVAIIMDGNRRWSHQHGLDLMEGYRRGVGALRSAVAAAIDHRVDVLTVYGFSTENWRREASEVSLLMHVCASAAQSELFGLVRESVRVRVVGDIAPFPRQTRAALKQLVNATAKNSRLTLQLALNYSGRAEILRAVRSIVAEAATGNVRSDQIDETFLRARMYAPDCPDPDLLIRTGGDLRVSNFLLYQLAYTEIVATPVLWPDFDASHFAAAISDFDHRRRRFGA
ncbi:MAG: di-trans,poly-cis-decaprenylcistransferase [Candidatus Eremiobacteraeota bacterium]|nr:di-trans,poly-cis-decaprenylcistransferase [Candidatus Eremiobacteraeota bacterium]